MKEFIEKLIGRLEEIPVENRCRECPHKQKCDEVQENINNEYTDLCGATIKALAIEIVNQLAEEYNNGWIPCSERLPEEYGEYFIWWTDITEKEYCEISEFHPEEGWIGNIPQAFSGKYTVIAWRELPGPFKRKGE